MFLLCRCGGLRGGIAALHGDLTWMSMDRYGLGGLFLNDGYGWYKGLDSSLCSE